MMKNFLYLLGAVAGFSLSACQAPYSPQRINTQLVNVSAQTPENPEIQAYIAPYRQHIENDLGKVLAYNPSDLNKEKLADNTPLGNFMAEAGYQQADAEFFKQTGKHIDFALFNWGGVRSGLPKGDITMRSAFLLMPFENELVVLEISGEKMLEMVQYLAGTSAPHPISHHVEILIDEKNGAPLKFLVGGKPVEAHRTYWVATTDYLAGGGDRMNFFLNPLKNHNLGYRYRNALIDYFRSIDTLKTQTDNRLKKIKN